MVNLINVYNNKVKNMPIKILTDETVFITSIMQVAVEDINSRFNNACNELISVLDSNNVSEAVEQIGIALMVTYDNARVMIDMFNRIMADTSDCRIRRYHE